MVVVVAFTGVAVVVMYNVVAPENVGVGSMFSVIRPVGALYEIMETRTAWLAPPPSVGTTIDAAIDASVSASVLGP